MKNVFLFALAVIFLSCAPQQQPVTTTVKTVTITEDLDTQGFLISKEMVVQGNTVWGFSQKAYGTGMHWRDIVAQNPFLQQPGRVYYDDSRKWWIVKIYPGESVNIGGTFVTPIYSYTSEEVSTTTGPTSVSQASAIPWWGWVLIALGIVGLIFLFNLFLNRGWGQNNSNSATSNSSSSVYVNLRGNNGGGIDVATERELLRQNVIQHRVLDFVEDHDWDEMQFRNRTMGIIKRDSKKGQLEKFEIKEDSDWFNVSAKYKGGDKKKKKTKKEEGK